MKNIEIRSRAWELLWRKKWFWKLLGATILLQVAGNALASLVTAIPARFGIYSISVLQADLQAGESPPVFTPDLAVEFVSSTVLYLFFAVIITGITNYGSGKLLTRAVDDNEESWMGAAFSGVKMPLGLAWLTVRIALVFIFWTIAAALPAVMLSCVCEVFFGSLSTFAGIVAVSLVLILSSASFIAIICFPFYRYRYLMRIKADNPGWTAGQCMRHCRLLTAGEKWRIFKHDCSYWRIFLIPLALAAVIAILLFVVFGSLGSAVAGESDGGNIAVALLLGAFALFVAYLALVVSSFVACFYNAVGQTVLYREISSEKQQRKESPDEMVS